MRIDRIEVAFVRAPLAKPYQLSFRTLDMFESVLVRIERSDGAVGVGEAVALPGYGSETTTSILDRVSELTADAVGMPLETLTERARAIWPRAPFAASAVVTAIELPDWIPHVSVESAFALNAAVAPANGGDELRCAVEQALGAGYQHLKLKIGRDVTQDIAAARELLEGLSNRAFYLVIDANQAYSWSTALNFVRALEDMDCSRLLWLEQPVDREDWSGIEELCRNTEVPIVLDECIYGHADVRRAAAIGARGVKLKIFKNFGLAETVRLAEMARSLGLLVVFGNGVATDIGNLAEFLVLSSTPRLFHEPSESSGFAKLVHPVSASGLGLAVERGRFVCRSSPAIIINELAGLHLWS